MNLAIVEEARFDSVHEALKYAFRAESLMQGSRTEIDNPPRKQLPGPDDEKWDIRFRELRNGLDVKDTITDGKMVKNTGLHAIDKYLETKNRYAITTQFRHIDSIWSFQFEQDFLTDKIKEEKPTLSYWFINDVVRDWTNHRGHIKLAPKHDLEWWRLHLGKPRSTIYSNATSKRPRDKSIQFLLNTWYDEGMMVITQAYYRTGIIY